MKPLRQDPLLTARGERLGRMTLAALAAALALILSPTPSRAHAPSNATLDLAADGALVQQRWDIALRDIDRVLPLDANDDGEITWAELRAAWPQISLMADDGLHLTVSSGHTSAPQPTLAADDKPCTAGPLDAPRIDTHADGTYAVLTRNWHCAALASDPGSASLSIEYRLFAQSDASHRGLLQWRPSAESAATTAVLAPGAVPVPLALAAHPDATAAGAAGAGANGSGAHIDDAGPTTGWRGFIAEGVHHILIGTDHVLFLLALMLPAVLRPRGLGRAGGSAKAMATATGLTDAWRWQSAVLQVAKVVTAFTVAHSITLALAVLGYANPPTRVVESLIAASVILAALDNLRLSGPWLRVVSGSAAVGLSPSPVLPLQTARLVNVADVADIACGAALAPTAPPAPLASPAPHALTAGGHHTGWMSRWRTVAFAFGFGLVHGFGFAGALRELGLDDAALARSLLGFNVGVELGQLGIVAVALPLAWWARETPFYRRVVLGGGSLAIAAVAMVWLVERAFDAVVWG